MAHLDSPRRGANIHWLCTRLCKYSADRAINRYRVGETLNYFDPSEPGVLVQGYKTLWMLKESPIVSEDTFPSFPRTGTSTIESGQWNTFVSTAFVQERFVYLFLFLLPFLFLPPLFSLISMETSRSFHNFFPVRRFPFISPFLLRSPPPPSVFFPIAKSQH